MTEKELYFVAQAKRVMPESFMVHTVDDRILAFVEMVISDLNIFPPLTGYSVETLPTRYAPVVMFGVQFFAMLFWQMNATLQDFNYNDNGLTVQVDQTAKINMALANVGETYKGMIENAKKPEIWKVGPAGLASPRYQAALGQFLKIALGDAFTWNSY